MEIKSGAYDSQAEDLLYQQNAQMVMLIVVDGKKGHGMSVAIRSDNPNAEDIALATPNLLRKLADLIEKTGNFQKGPFLNNHSHTWADLSQEEGK